MENSVELDEVEFSLLEVQVKKKSFTQKYRWVIIFFIGCALFLSIIFFFVLGYIYFGQPAPIPPNEPIVVTRAFKFFSVIFDKDKSRPIRSIQFIFNPNPGNQTDNIFRRDKDFKIEDEDYNNIGYVKGSLTPWKNIGMESQSIINVVPQVACFNENVWGAFESFLFTYFHFSEITTFPRFDDEKTILTNGKILYIPNKICKNIKGVGEFCMENSELTCKLPYSTNWCQQLQPNFPGMSTDCNYTPTKNE
jgi:hypothetical protein